MRRERLEQAKKLMEAMKPLVWTGTLKELARRIGEFDTYIWSIEPVARESHASPSICLPAQDVRRSNKTS